MMGAPSDSSDTRRDLGPILWVRGEIEAALARAVAVVRDEAGDDVQAAARTARAHLYQARGALNMVGLDGSGRFIEVLEQLLADWADGRVADKSAVGDLLERSVAALSRVLDVVTQGGEEQGLSLLPFYAQVNALRGVDPPEPSELFFPDLSRVPALSVARDDAQPDLARLRGRFQRGLLEWLRGRDGLAEMRAVVTDIGAMPGPAGARAFWWATTAFFDSLDGAGPAPDLATKRLTARIEQQIRRLQAGSRTVAERLQRELLYRVAVAERDGGAIDQVRQAYGLHRLLPAANIVESTPWEPILRRLREHLGAAKEHWARFSAGAAVSLPIFHEQVNELERAGRDLGGNELTQLLSALAAVARWLRRDPLLADDAIAMEVATAMLVAEQALEQWGRADVQAVEAARTMSARLDALARGERPELAPPPLQDAARRAEQRLLLGQTAREMRSELALIEQQLDAWYRDADSRPDEDVLEKAFRRLSGAFTLLDENEAVRLLTDCQQRLRGMLARPEPAAHEAIESLAQPLSALGLFIDALPAGHADLATILAPRPVTPAVASVETELATAARDVRSLAAALEERPKDAELRAALQAGLQAISQDAQLVADTDLEHGARAALAALADPQQTSADTLAEAVAKVAGKAVVQPSEDAARLIDVPEAELDAELLGIFIDEADENLATIGDELLKLSSGRHDQEALSSVRRSFHTLKGSGRMVGLRDFGEAAWAVERVLNQCLQRDHTASSELIDLVERARALLVDWVAQLRTGSVATLPYDWLKEACEQMLAGDEMPVPEPITPAADLRHIGPVAVPQHLFDLFLTEARTHVAVLRRELARLHVNPALVPSDDSVRAAHTLAGIAGTIGFTMVRDLARSLQSVLERFSIAKHQPDTDQVSLLSAAAAQLDTMVGAIADGNWPEPAAVLVARLADIDGAAERPAAALVEDAAPAIDLEVSAEAVGEETLEPIWPDGLDVEEAARKVVEITDPALDMPAPLVEQFEASAVSTPSVPTEIALPTQRSLPSGEETGSIGVRDDIDASLLPIFLEEAHELVQAIGAELRAWQLAPTSPEHQLALTRFLHTLKGSARMAGAMHFGEAIHALESRLKDVGMSPDELFFEGFQLDFDRAVDLLQGLSRQAVVAPEDDRPDQDGADSVDEDLPQNESSPTLRVRADLVDRFINEAGEIAISRSRIASELQQLRLGLGELTENVARLRAQLREVEMQAEMQLQSRIAQTEAQHAAFDPLEMDRYTRLQELTRILAESAEDVLTVQHALQRNLESAESALGTQSRLNRALSQSLMGVRLVVFGTIVERLHRTVRQTARELGKQVALRVVNEQAEFDREILERVVGPLEHILRNAVSHGIEEVSVRLAAGKPAQGEVVMALEQRSNEIEIRVVDDGAGLDFERIRQRAIERKLLEPEADPTRAELTQLIFAAGFSTATEVSEISGRGVGMDVVKSEVTALGGRIELESEDGRGTAITIRLPLTLALMPAVLVRVGDRTYAIPAALVDALEEMKGDLETVRAGDLVQDGQRWRYAHLSDLLGVDRHAAVSPWLLRVRAGTQRLALEVEGVRGRQEIVVKSAGPQVARLPGFVGATVLADGEVVFIVNPVLWSARPVRHRPLPETQKTELPGLVMVVDDSVTVRKVTSRLLEREGYRVATAKDGLDALEKLVDLMPQLILLDLEMPRMDGFELARALRADARLKDIPIIVISSRTAERHRALARELGIAHYLGKPYDETELLGLVGQHVGPVGHQTLV